MFICESCHEAIGPRISPKVFVTKTREKAYVNLVRVDNHTHTVYSEGKEIVKEVNLCPDCASGN